MWGIKYDNWIGRPRYPNHKYKLIHWVALPTGKLRTFETLDQATTWAEAINKELSGDNCYYPSRIQ